MDGLDSTTGIVALAAAGLALVATLLAATALLKLRRLRADQRLVLGEGEERDVIAHSAALDRKVSNLEAGIDDVTRVLFERLDDAELRLDGSVSRTAVIRYDAFKENSGRQSSTIALLDDGGNGVVLSAILQREQARVYAKPVQAGRSELELSPEELEAIQRAGERRGDPGE